MAYGSDDERIKLVYPNPAQYFTRGITFLLVVLLAGHILHMVAGDWVADWLMLSNPGLGRGRVWTLLTYSIINRSGWALVGSMVTLLLCGSAIEHEWRARSLLILWVVVAVSCGLLFVLTCTIMSVIRGEPFYPFAATSSAAVYGIFGAFGLIFRRRRVLSVLFVFEAQYFVLLLIGIGIILTLRTPVGLVFVAGAGVAYLYIKLIWRRQFGRSRKRSSEVGRFVEID